MNPLYGFMYTRPGSLCQSFEIVREVSKNKQGYLTNRYEQTGEPPVKGMLSAAGSSEAERTKHLWDQDQHSLTHILALSGKAAARKGDILVGKEKSYLVLTTDNQGMVGGSSILYLEERSDLK